MKTRKKDKPDSRNQGLMAIGGIILAMLLLFISLPGILKLLGFHPDYPGDPISLPGKRALIVTTSHSTLGEGGPSTGVYASEMTIPYYAFLDAGLTVDLASIQGGAIPIEPMSLRYPLITRADRRFLKDPAYLGKVKNSLNIDSVQAADYDLIYLAGGWGAAYDLGTSMALGELITEANTREIILGSVCHGALGLLLATGTDGKPLLKGRKVTGVTDKQVRELKITVTPMHPETELRGIGAAYQSNTAFRDFFANLTVVDGNLVTGQNQNAGSETAYKMLAQLKEKSGGQSD